MSAIASVPSQGKPANGESTPTLARATYERLRTDLLNGQWQPGRKLLMHELRARYEVGASPLREALNRLCSEQWVVHNDQRGFSVAQVSTEQLHDLVRTRIAVEGLALEQAVARRDPEWEEQLVLAFHRLSRTPRSMQGDNFETNPEWERLHRAFHRTLLAGCASPLLVGFCEELYEKAYRYRQLAATKSYRRRNELDEHRAVFEAVLAGKAQDAKGLLAAHYQRTAGIVEE
jgi:DNA-binding GntR family transcriptional regulator